MKEKSKDYQYKQQITKANIIQSFCKQEEKE